MRRFGVPCLLAAVLGCSSGTAADGDGSPRPEKASPEHPLIFKLDRSTPLPLLSILATEEEAARLRARYASFLSEMGPPRNGVTLSLRFDKKGSLGIPWNFYLPRYAPPYPVRLVGILPDGSREVIREERF